VRVGDYIVDLNPFDKFIESLRGRLLEGYSTQFLAQLRLRQNKVEDDSEPIKTVTTNLEKPELSTL
jgi:hypothetical protein